MPANFTKSAIIAAGVLACLSLEGCGGVNPATQEAVQMQPGAYEVELAGAPFGFAIAAQKQNRRCISGSPDNVPTALVRPYMMFHAHCESAKFTRTGNQLTSHAVCPLNPEASGNGTMALDFTGTITAEGITGKTSLKIDAHFDDPDAAAGVALLNNTSISVTAKRVGDCKQFGQREYGS